MAMTQDNSHSMRNDRTEGLRKEGTPARRWWRPDGCTRCRTIRRRIRALAGRLLPLVLLVALVGLFAAFGALRPLVWHRMTGWGVAILLAVHAVRSLPALPRLWLDTPFTLGEARRRGEALLGHALGLHLGLASLAATLSGQSLYAAGRRWSDFSLALHAACANWALLAAALLAGFVLFTRIRRPGDGAHVPPAGALSRPSRRRGTGCTGCTGS